MNTEIGILDPLGKNKNPLNGYSYSNEYRQFAEKWSNLPAYKNGNAQKIIDILSDNQVILIQSGTGSGKTVLIPKYALHSLGYEGKVIVTLPKRIIAKSSAEFAALTLDVKLGEEIGYFYKGESLKTDNSKLLYVTDGSLKSLLFKDPLLNEFNTIIIDEAHERKVQIDFLLYLLKDILKKRKDFKLIIMSATINSTIFEKYYSEFKFYSMMLEGEANYPIESVFSRKDESYQKTIEMGIEYIKSLIKTNEKGDIIFFVTSPAETITICNRFRKLDQFKRILCISLHGNTNESDKKLAKSSTLYKESGLYDRKLIIATNVAESSITIDGLMFVIDTGYEFMDIYDPNIRGYVKKRRNITKAQVKQRMGRTGRTGPGICFHLYTKNKFDSFLDYPDPEIKITDLTQDCLQLLNNITYTKPLLDMFLNFIEPPKENYLVDSLTKLELYGLVYKGEITKFGRTISNFRMDISQAITIYYSIQNECFNEIIKIITICNVLSDNMSNLFIKVDDKNLNELNKVKKSFSHEYGDHISLLLIYEKFSQLYRDRSKELNKWCNDRFIRKDILINIFNQVNKSENIKTRIKDIDIIENQAIKGFKLEDKLIYCLSKGYAINVAKRNKYGSYQTDLLDNIEIDKASFINYHKLPKNVIFNGLFSMNNSYSLNLVSKIPKKIYDLI